jgi:hypothetical protein
VPRRFLNDKPTQNFFQIYLAIQIIQSIGSSRLPPFNALKSFQNHFAMADFGSPFRNQMMDGQTSGPPKPLRDFVLSAYFKQLEVSIEAFDQNQT